MINQVVSKRMVKKQQMQWTPQGAHLFLQVRTQVLNEEVGRHLPHLVSQLLPGADAGASLTSSSSLTPRRFSALPGISVGDQPTPAPCVAHPQLALPPLDTICILI